MKHFILILFLITSNTAIFSQIDNIISLDECIQAAVESHPLQKQKTILENSLIVRQDLQDRMALPGINWNAQVKLQSESLGLDFENALIPSIEIPLYSAQTSLDLNYTLYDGGIKKSVKAINRQNTALSLEKNSIAIDQIKKEVLNQYLIFLFLKQKDKILNNSLELIKENIQTLSAARQYGVVQKTDLQQLQLKEKELASGIRANKRDIETSLQLLNAVTGLSLDESYTLMYPQLENFIVDTGIEESKLKIFDLQKQLVNAQELTIDAKTKPKVFAFLTAGTGYPNPLNLFDDELSLFAIGGIGFSWNIFNWGTAKREKQLVRLQKDLIDTEKMNTTSTLNRYNQRFQIGIEKFLQQIEDETDMINLKKEIAATQKSRLEEGVIIPFEYISNLNDIIKSELNLNLYNLEIIKLKLEYQLLKGQL